MHNLADEHAVITRYLVPVNTILMGILMGVENSLLESALSSVFLSVLVVVSLYIWSGSFSADRNAPKVIQRRMTSMILVSIFSTVYLYVFLSSLSQSKSLWIWLGIPVHQSIRMWIQQMFISGSLVVILFIGPLFNTIFVEYTIYTKKSPYFWSLGTLYTFSKLKWKRFFWVENKWMPIRDFIVVSPASNLCECTVFINVD